MPLYEYACTACGNRFEVRQRIVEEPISVCPSCGGTTRRVLHPAGIIFKGSGWYSTDSRKPEPATSTAEKTSPESTTPEPKKESAGGNTSRADSTSKPTAGSATEH